MDNILGDLICPITHELFEDPIVVPCCQRAFSRASLIHYFNLNGHQICPLCRTLLTDYDTANEPKNIVIANIVDSFRNKDKQNYGIINNVNTQNEQKWSAELVPIKNNLGHLLPVGQLRINLENAKFVAKPTLFIAVVDRSGSMSGGPWKQVETALLHIMSLSRSNPNVKTVIVAYESDAEIINTNGTVADVTRIIKTMFTGGGTNFRAAFKKIKEVLLRYISSDLEEYRNNENNVSNVSVAFLTDGQSGENNNSLVNEFTTILKNNWNGQINVHSIGFGQDCDKELLEGLRKTGTTDGMFRYAEPNDNGDTLCSKLTSLFEYVSKSSTISLDVHLENGKIVKNNNLSTQKTTVQFPINENKKGYLAQWILYDPNIDIGKIKLESCLDKVELIVNKKDLSVDENKKLYNDWLDILVDEIASDVLELSKINKQSYGTNLYELHCSLIENRIDAIQICLTRTETIERLNYIQNELLSLKMGGTVNMGKLSDFRFSSQFVTIESKQKISRQHNVVVDQQIKTINDKPAWKEVKIKYSRNNSNKNRNKLQMEIMANNFNKVTNGIKNELTQMDQFNIMFQDINGNTALHLAAYCGQNLTIEEIIKKFPNINLNVVNNDNETPLTLAIKTRGFWKTITTLLNHGAVIPTERRKSLEQFAIDNNYKTTADMISCIDDDMTSVNNSMTNEYIMFVYERAIKNKLEFDVQKFLEIAISKCMIKLIHDLVDQHNAKPTIDMLFELCVPESPEHFEIFKMLMTYPYKDYQINVNQANNNGDSLLFRASEKGCTEHLKFLINLGATVDQQNILGNTPLWIACWKRYPCIINALIDAGADVNCVNFKGNPPIVSICQKGPRKIAELLLARGAQIEQLNTNGDSMILICCRNGQHDVLNLLLNYASPTLINHRAHIDGFSALFASTESNRPECIKELINYGCNIEEKTDSDNQILPGATSLHLAAYYGRTEAAEMLLSLGADPNSRDINNQTPLHIAVIQGNISIVKLLKNTGGDLNAIDNLGNTPLSYSRNSDIIKILSNPLCHILMKFARGQFSPNEEKEVFNLINIRSESIGCVSKKNIIDIASNDGTTLLTESVLYSSIEPTKILLQLGSDINKKNMYGLNAYFWMKWNNNQRIKQLMLEVIDTDIESIINYIKDLSKASSHNSLILYMGSKPSKIIDVDKSSPIKKKMDKYINFNQICSYVANKNNQLVLSKNQNYESSIIEFFNRKELNTLNLQDLFNNLIWNSKIFALNMSASTNNILSPQHIMALHLYSSNFILCETINESLIKNNVEYIKPYVECLYDAVSLLPSYTGEVFIGTDNLIDRKLYLIGNEICWPTFMSGSSLWKIAVENTPNFSTNKKNGTVFIIKSKNGRFVGKYSQYSYDSEVIFLPNTKFVVTMWYYGDVICLGQSNIRHSTFKIKDENMDKMITGNHSLIIEMLEI